MRCPRRRARRGCSASSVTPAIGRVETALADRAMLRLASTVVVQRYHAIPRAGRTREERVMTETAPDAMEPYVDELLPGFFDVMRAVLESWRTGTVATSVQVTSGSTRRGMAGEADGRPPPTHAGAGAVVRERLVERGAHVALLIVDATIASDKTAGHARGQARWTHRRSELDVVAAIKYLDEQSAARWSTRAADHADRLDRWVPSGTLTRLLHHAELWRHRPARPSGEPRGRAALACREPRLRVRLDVRLAHPLA